MTAVLSANCSTKNRLRTRRFYLRYGADRPRLRKDKLNAETQRSQRRNYESDQPKISFTLSKMDELRSAGLFSTFRVVPSCSINLRWSRVSLVGVSTRTW